MRWRGVAGRGGVTLLELMLSLALLGIVAAGVIGLVVAATQLSDEVERAGRERARDDALVGVMRRAFHELPSGCGVVLRAERLGGDQVASWLVFSEAPSALLPGAIGGDRRVALVVDEVAGGYLRLVLVVGRTRAEERARGAGDAGYIEDPAAVVVLMDELASFRWRVLERGGDRERDWLVGWSRPWRPELVELVWRRPGGAERRDLFWVPVREVGAAGLGGGGDEP